ncbi:MAG: hypothetical protein O9353_05625 [Bacteroidia bacterium]|nr:hypothetical protein [Bacteroidia bacterium]
MTMIKKISLSLASLLLSNNVFSQSSTATNNWAPGRFVGYGVSNGVNPLLFQTNATDRMVINGNKTVGINGFLGLALTHDILIFLAYDFNQRSGIP